MYQNSDESRPAGDLAEAAVEFHPPRSSRLPSRNRYLAIVLASVAALSFAIVILLAVMLHYEEAHHIVAGL